MLKDLAGPCHSDPERSGGEESRSETKDLARFLVVPIRSGLLGMTRRIASRRPAHGEPGETVGEYARPRRRVHPLGQIARAPGNRIAETDH